MESYAPALVAALLCGAAGLGVPALVARIPEPDEPADDKEPYAAIAARPGLTWKAALASLVAGGLIGAELGWAWPLVYLLPLVPVGVALAVVDWRTLLLPTKVIRPAYALVVVGVLVCWVATRDTDDLVRAGWGFAGVVRAVLADVADLLAGHGVRRRPAQRRARHRPRPARLG